jgi:serine/threonine-protein kinase RsbW
LSKICAFVVREAGEAGLDDTAAYGVELAVDEACTNIIEHAYGGEGKGEIECTARATKDGLVIILRDKGKAFDPTGVPDPDVNAPLEKLPSRGAGLFLMRKMMDEVHFEFRKGKGNTLTMLKRR